MANHGPNSGGGTAQPSFGPALNSGPLFRHPTHAEVVNAVVGDIGGGRAIVAVRGEPGVGKTTQIPVIAAELRSRGRLVIMAGAASATPSQVLRSIGNALGIADEVTNDPGALLELFRTREGAERLVLIIDDAEALTAPMFRYLGLLLELFDLRPAKLQVILLGAPGQWPALQHPDLDPMRQATLSRHMFYAQSNKAPPLSAAHKWVSAPGTALARPSNAGNRAARTVPAFGYTPAAAHRKWGRRASIAALCVLFVGGAAVTFIVNQIPTSRQEPGVIPGDQSSLTPVTPTTRSPEITPQTPSSPVEPEPADRQTGQAVSPALEAPPSPTGRGGPGLVLVAGAGDSLPNLYARVYRGVRPPPYPQVVAANRMPVKPGTLVVFPEPPAGWPPQ